LLIENAVRPEERSPEKAGGGGSSRSLATIFIICLLLQAGMKGSHSVVLSQDDPNHYRVDSFERSLRPESEAEESKTSSILSGHSVFYEGWSR